MLITEFHLLRRVYAVAVPAALMMGLAKSGLAAGGGTLAVAADGAWRCPYRRPPGVLLPLPVLGVWVGVRLAKRVSGARFKRLLLAGRLLTGQKLLWDGTRGLLGAS